jgi:hypothetical protein
MYAELSNGICPDRELATSSIDWSNVWKASSLVCRWFGAEDWLDLYVYFVVDELIPDENIRSDSTL